MHVINPSTWKVEAETEEVFLSSRQPVLHSELQDSRDYIEKPCVQKMYIYLMYNSISLCSDNIQNYLYSLRLCGLDYHLF